MFSITMEDLSNKTELLWLYFDFENRFNPVIPYSWMQTHWHHSMTISVIYLAVIFSVQRLMKCRHAFDLRGPLTMWNVVLAVFSVLGALRTVPDLFMHLQHGFRHSICDKGQDGWGCIGLWTALFVYSKPVELIDTIFVVLRKKPLIFLHWYHHITVFVFSWHTAKEHPAPGRWFVAMNFTVHAIMYTYYSFRSSGWCIPKAVPLFVTSMQLLQMFVGCAITIQVALLRLQNAECYQSDSNTCFGIVIYLTYLLLFVNFFKNAYLKKKLRKDNINSEKLIDQGWDEKGDRQSHSFAVDHTDIRRRKAEKA